jgi:methylated-DNA-[protein]-cysteine S-methyltransferase
MQEKELSTTINSPIGKIKVVVSDNALTNVKLLPKNNDTQPSTNQTNLIKNVIRQIENYFADSTFSFNLPLTPKGTKFQQKVWRVLQEIPCGEIRTYAELAATLKTSPRAIGNACRANPLPIIIPCHRVVGKNNTGGFMGKTAGQSLEIKQWLLEHERQN